MITLEEFYRAKCDAYNQALRDLVNFKGKALSEAKRLVRGLDTSGLAWDEDEEASRFFVEAKGESRYADRRQGIDLPPTDQSHAFTQSVH